MSLSLQSLQTRVETALDNALSNPQVPERLLEAMRYSTLNGGKRIRALFTYCAGLSVDAPIEKLDAVAVAIECLHAYSLIHDDLPAMDDDNLRRGKPTNHVQFDEATAILAGDALQSLAFEVIVQSTLSDAQARAITTQLTQSAGPVGMVGGQMLDILATDQTLNRAEMEDIHRRKTGALIHASVLCGALCSDSLSELEQSALVTYAENLGLAFQVVDDVLDVEGSTEELGKPSGSDVAAGKATFPVLLGLAESKSLAQNLCRVAMESIDTISDNRNTSTARSMLRELAERIVNRTH
ncbi:polyprenyl synthetase family protein [Arenicella xantha]|uniref:Farnesyl-diphosphate synthase n=1 Tax=Arenicella xantha TaxID=644221 RepID=A0A395JF30_9GAMM|nr:farnesyl diphosphate synthase [Arenicella xantha]RBP48294.1 farnesyl-diphosphate synthase [Arenicella xantha]